MCLILDDRTRRFNQGEPHPIGKNKVYDQRQGSLANYPSLAWYQEHCTDVVSSGTAVRSFYTSLGHLNETWEVRFMWCCRKKTEMLTCVHYQGQTAHDSYTGWDSVDTTGEYDPSVQFQCTCASPGSTHSTSGTMSAL